MARDLMEAVKKCLELKLSSRNLSVLGTETYVFSRPQGCGFERGALVAYDRTHRVESVFSWDCL